MKEAEIGDTEQQSGATPDAPQEPTPEQLKLVQDFLKSIAVIADASEDAGIEKQEDFEQQLAEAPGSKARRRQRRLKRQRQEYTQKIKDHAGLAGIKLKDFTPEQRALYDETKALFRQEKEQSEFEVLNTLTNGNLLDVPLVKNIVDQGGTPLKVALTLVAGECAADITLTCLTQQLMQQAQGLGM